MSGETATEAEIEQLIEMHRAGVSVAQIGKALGWGPDRVIRRLGQMGLVPNRVTTPHATWPTDLHFRDDPRAVRDPGSGALPARPPTAVTPRTDWSD